MNIFYHKNLRNHLLQLCPKVVKHPVDQKYIHDLVSKIRLIVKPIKSYWHLTQNSTISMWVRTWDYKPWNLLRGSVWSRNYHGQGPPTALTGVQRTTTFTLKNLTEMVHLIFKGLITYDKITPLWYIHQRSTSENDYALGYVPELPNTISSG